MGVRSLLVQGGDRAECYCEAQADADDDAGEHAWWWTGNVRRWRRPSRHPKGEGAGKWRWRRGCHARGERGLRGW